MGGGNVGEPFVTDVGEVGVGPVRVLECVGREGVVGLEEVGCKVWVGEVDRGVGGRVYDARKERAGVGRRRVGVVRGRGGRRGLGWSSVEGYGTRGTEGEGCPSSSVRGEHVRPRALLTDSSERGHETC